MPEIKETSKKQHTPCPGCGGSGQTSFFGGASRFILSWEDCPDCCGTGVLLDASDIDYPEEQVGKHEADNGKFT